VVHDKYRLKRRRFVAGYVQPVTQQYQSTTVLKSTSAIKVAIMKITDDFHYKLV